MTLQIVLHLLFVALCLSIVSRWAVSTWKSTTVWGRWMLGGVLLGLGLIGFGWLLIYFGIGRLGS